MNVLFLSPFFPPNAHHFCTALARRGARVLGLGDAAPDQHQELGDALSEYVFEPGMADYESLKRAVAGLIVRHGKLDRLDSNGEHWLEAEGRLRDDFGVPGLGQAETRALRSKLHMGQCFARAGVPYPPTTPGTPEERVRSFVHEYGFPVVVKPDAGSGAVDTFVVRNEAELGGALQRALSGHVIQRFVDGEIVTFDGLTDAAGRIVFYTSHAYDNGIMQVREGCLDGHYYSLRDIPAELLRIGRLSVAAFGIRERFFHLEFFALPDGSYVGLEMNIRPPGGFTTDMMSAACDVDIYDLWAAIITGAALDDFRYQRRYHTAHAGRRLSRVYRHSPEQLQRKLGETIFSIRHVPDAFAVTMGNVAYLLRHEDLATLKRAVLLVQELA